MKSPPPKLVEITLAQSGRGLKLPPKRAFGGHIPGVSDSFLCSQGELAKQGAKNGPSTADWAKDIYYG